MKIYEIRTHTRTHTRTIRVAAESGPKAIAIARGANHRVVGGARLAKIQVGRVTYTQRCPECGSRRTKVASTNFGPEFVCNDCGHQTAI